jgi:hypothetical protein
MKTTTYIFEGGKVTMTVTDEPELTREQYAECCRTISIAALSGKSRRGSEHFA